MTILEEVLSPFKSDPLVCANFNCPGQIVISGQKDSLQKVIPLIKEKGGKVIPLKVSGAFHSPLMQKGSDHLETYLKEIQVQDAAFPIILNRTAQIEAESEN